MFTHAIFSPEISSETIANEILLSLGKYLDLEQKKHDAARLLSPQSMVLYNTLSKMDKQASLNLLIETLFFCKTRLEQKDWDRPYLSNLYQNLMTACTLEKKFANDLLSIHYQAQNLKRYALEASSVTSLEKSEKYKREMHTIFDTFFTLLKTCKTITPAMYRKHIRNH